MPPWSTSRCSTRSTGFASTIDEGFAISAQIGWVAIMGRACDAVADLPEDTYANVRHFFTDPQTPDYDEPAASLAQNRGLAFLSTL